MNILFLTQFYWPEVRTAPLNLAALAEDLSAKGHNITVMTGFPNHPYGRVYEGYRMKIWEWESISGVHVLRLPLFPDHSLSGFRRALNYGSFTLSALLAGSFCTRKTKVDVIFAYLPPLTIGIPAAFLSRAKQAPVVYWLTDLWPENLQAARANISPYIVNKIHRLADWVYRKSTFVCVNSPGLATALIEKGVTPAKIHLLTDWADEKRFFPAPHDEQLAAQCGMSRKFNIVYGGNVGKVQGLDVVIHAARHIQNKPQIQFVIIGDGTEAARLKQMAEQNALANILFISRKPPDEIYKYFALADVLLAHLEKKPIFKMQIPSKIIAYLACGRPILCGIEGEAAKLVQEAGAGITFVPQDAQHLAEQVRLLYNLQRAQREEMGRNAREAYLNNYTRSIQAARVEQILQEALRNSQN